MPEIYKKNSSPKVVYGIILIVAVIFGFFGGVYFGLKINNQADTNASLQTVISQLSGQNTGIDFSLFKKVWDDVRTFYIRQPVDEKKLFYGALTGLVASLDDPYSNFLDPETTKAFNSEFSGSFEGIGAEIGIKNDQLVIIAPLPGSPAEKAGLKSKDQILQIDGQETNSFSLDYATSLIRGKKGTEVTLLILSEGDTEAREVAITRDEIKVNSVRQSVKNAGENGRYKLGYIELMTFGDDTEKEFKNAANLLVGQGINGIILDLRNNSGGYLETAVTVASQFIDKGAIVNEEFSDQTKKSYEAQGFAPLADYPVVVLINGGTASAAEIVAGALRDYEKAVLVGETSFGKGSVQEYQQLSDGSSLKITTAKWLTPKGQSLNEEGIEPDYAVELSADDFNNDKDPQLDKALEILADKLNK
ncbi:MAG: S41 family peptidase [Patescibacteria group bacterium]